MDPSNILQYQSPPAKGWHIRWWWVLVWMIVSAILWRSIDWWNYAYQGPGKPMLPKFETALWFQLSASLAMGLVATAVLGVVFAICLHLRAPR
jgi:hypothetical protein